jgi:3-oxoacyl-[acyl-carrier protein] reductase
MIEAQGGKAELLPFDVTDKVASDAALTTWRDAHPEDYIAVLVNNNGARKMMRYYPRNGV